MPRKILVAVAWPYVNGDLHPGHLAGYLLPADIFAHYHRLIGNDVLMVSGSDCHGTPITLQADIEKEKPQELVKRYHKSNIELFKLYDLSYNLYTKTTTQNHKEAVQEIFLELLKNGYVSKDFTKQYYSPEENKFLPDRYVKGECPFCHDKDQLSDQCEACGKMLNGGDLINPKSKLSGNRVVLKETEHYFLDLDKLEKQVKKFINSKKGIWRKWVWAEAIGWIKQGLEKRTISRDIDWGIELPSEEIKSFSKDLSLKDSERKRFYVWFEAVIGYLSAAREWSQTKKGNKEIIFKRFAGQSRNWKDWWLNSEAEHYYFMGQDNLVFHTIVWPAQLIGVDNNYQLPHNVVANRFLTYEGKKFSKSRKWIINSKKLAKEYGLDCVRYYLTSILPENKEADFTWKGFQDAVNNELVANLGNFVNRTLKFIENNYEGKIEQDDFEIEEETKKKIEETFSKTGELIKKTELTSGLKQIMELSAWANKYFSDYKIWELYRGNPKEAETKLLNLANIIFNLPVLLIPYLPLAAQNLAKLLGREIDEAEVGKNIWQAEITNKIKLTKAVKPLFQKIEQIKKL